MAPSLNLGSSPDWLRLKGALQPSGISTATWGSALLWAIGFNGNHSNPCVQICMLRSGEIVWNCLEQVSRTQWSTTTLWRPSLFAPEACVDLKATSARNFQWEKCQFIFFCLKIDFQLGKNAIIRAVQLKKNKKKNKQSLLRLFVTTFVAVPVWLISKYDEQRSETSSATTVSMQHLILTRQSQAVKCGPSNATNTRTTQTCAKRALPTVGLQQMLGNKTVTAPFIKGINILQQTKTPNKDPQFKLDKARQKCCPDFSTRS